MNITTPIISMSVTRKVIAPTRGTQFSAGLDFYIPEDLTLGELRECYRNIGKDISEHINKVNFSDIGDVNEKDYITMLEIMPGGELFVPTGVKVKLQNNTILKFENKSGIASKRGLLIGACVVDEDYQGIVHINMWNVSRWSVRVYASDKIAQGIVYPVFLDMPNIVPVDELYSEVSERGTGGFGSTDNK